MPVGTREALLIIRAQDMASNVLRQIGMGFSDLDTAAQRAASKQMSLGAALTTAGIGVAAVGAAGLKFYADSTQAAIEYNRQANLTLTQTQGLGISLDQIKQIGIDVAKAIPAPFEQMQSSLYDIFSSMDVNAAQAQTLLTSFSKGAVAGQVDVQEASRATIGLMNAFKVPVQDVNKIMDIQFQLVAKGVGTYDEFAQVIGLVSPSATRAGQSIQSMAGMMAFLTRNGMDTSAAAAAAGRAFDSISNPKTIQHFKDMGMSITDANGNFRPMVDIVQQLSDKFKDLNPEQRATALKELFKSSGGNIQAMRFWSEAVNQVPELKEYTDAMYNAGGASDSAFNTMRKAPISQIEQFHNNMKILRVEAGDTFLPAVNKVATALSDLLTWFNNLSPGTKRLILEIGAGIAVFLTVAGVVMAIVGAFMFLSGAAALLEVSLGAIALTAGIWIVAILAIIAIGYELIKHWGDIKRIAGEVWDWIKTKIQAFASWVGPIFAAIWAPIQSGLTTLGNIFSSVWTVISAIITAAWTIIQPIFDALVNVFNNDIAPALQTLWTIVSAVFNAIGAVASWLWNTILGPMFNAIGSILTGVVIPALQFAWSIFSFVFGAIATIVQVFWSIFSVIIQMIVGILTVILRPVVQQLGDLFQLVWNNIAIVVRWAWENIVKPIWEGIVSYWNNVLKPVFLFIGSVWSQVWNGVSSMAKSVWEDIKHFVTVGVNDVVDIINGMIGKVEGGINDIIGAYNKIPGAPNVTPVALGRIPRLHSGGVVTGGQEEVLRVLLTGEGVLNRRAMSDIGPTGLNSLNRGAGVGSTMVVQEGAIQISVNGGEGDVSQQVQDGVAAALRQMYTELRSK